MRRTRGWVCPVWLAALLLVWLASMTALQADGITTPPNSTVFDDGMTYVPPSDLTGWFFNSNGPPPFPEPSDPSQIWTSPANIATLNYWLSLVTDLGDDPSMLQELYGLGMISAPNAAAVAAGEKLVAQILNAQTGNQGLAQQQQPSGVPEPVTLGLLGAGLALLTLYAILRMKRIRGGLPWRHAP